MRKLVQFGCCLTMLSAAAWAQTVATPAFFPPTGTQFANGQIVTLQSSTSGTTLCYTLDGSTPTATTPGTCLHGTTLANNGTVNISASETVKVLGTKSGDTNSAVATAAYIVGGGVTSNIDDIPPTSSGSPAIGWATPPYLDVGCTAYPASGYPHSTATSPTIDGFSSLFTINGPPEVCVGWFYNAGPQDTNNTVAINDFEYQSGSTNSTGNANEFDVYLYEKAVNSGGCLAHDTDFYFGTQCNTGTSDVQIWDQGGGLGWQYTSPRINCASAFAPGTGYHHVTMNDYWTCGDTSGASGYPKQCYKSIVIDGTTHPINTCYSASALPGGYGENSGLNVELDIGSAGTTLSANLDKMSLTFTSSTFYVSQSGGVATTGPLCNGQSTTSAATFNSSFAPILMPGSTAILCSTPGGNITTPIQVKASGTSGSVISYVADTGAVIAIPGTANSCPFVVNNNSYLLFDGGGAGGTNGILEVTGNGSGLASQNLVSAFCSTATSGNSEIRNWMLGPIYQHTSLTDITSSADTETNIWFSDNSSGLTGPLSIHDNVIHDVGTVYLMENASSSPLISFYNNYDYNVNWDFGIAPGNTTSAFTLNIHDNHFGAKTNWDTNNLCSGTSCFHHNVFHSFGRTDLATEIDFVNNLVDGDWGSCCATAVIYDETSALNHFTFANNVINQHAGNGYPILEPSNTGGTPGLIGGGYIVNNTIQCGTGSSNVINFHLYGTNYSAPPVIENNAFQNCNQFLNYQNESSLPGTLDYNYYMVQGAGGNQAWALSASSSNPPISGWQSACSCDSHSGYSATNYLNADGTPQLAFPGNGIGLNLSSIATGNLAALLNTTSAGNTVAPSARTIPWTIGAYVYAGATTFTLTQTVNGAGSVSSSPAGISCPSTCSASYSSGTAVTLTEAPSAGNVFLGWGGACFGSTTTCTVTMSAAENVTALFSVPGIVFNNIQSISGVSIN